MGYIKPQNLGIHSQNGQESNPVTEKTCAEISQSRMRKHRIIFQNAVQTRTPRLALVAPSTPSRFPRTPKALESRIP